MKAKLIAIAAMNQEGVIGVDNDMPWRIPEDFKHFRETTMGHTLVVGMNTYLTLPDKAFEGRKYIVLTRKAILNDSIPKRDNVVFMNHSSFRDLRESNQEQPEVYYIIGGATIYELYIDICDEAIITIVNKKVENGNKFFPIDDLFANFTALDDTAWITSKNGIEFKIKKYYNTSL